MKYRVFDCKVSEPASDATHISIVISTETPYLRTRIAGHQKAYEILGHDTSELDLTYMLDGAPFCFEHRTDQQVGVLENVRVEGQVLRADVRFSASSFAQDIFHDMSDGIRKRISVGYEVVTYTDAGDLNGIPVVRATQWVPYEASTVAIPADLHAGVGKNHFSHKDTTMLYPMFTFDANNTVIEAMLEDGTVISDPAEIAMLLADYQAHAADTEALPPIEDALPAIDEALPVIDDEELKRSTVLRMSNPTSLAKAKKERPMVNVKELTALAVKHNLTDNLASWIEGNRTVESVKSEILDGKSNVESVATPAVHTRKTAPTMESAVRAFLRNDSSELAERGVDAARQMGRSINPGTLYLPSDVPMIRSTRTAYLGGAGAGASAVGKEFLSWEESLREGSVLARVGGQIVTLADVASMPYFSVPASASQFAETGSVSNQFVTVAVRTWEPKRVAARYAYSNLLNRLSGTYSFESELTTDLLAEGIRQIDAQVWGGSGVNNITGLLNNTDITALNSMSSSLSLTNASSIMNAVATQNGLVAGGEFNYVVSHRLYADAFANGAFGAGSGTNVLSQVEASLGKVIGTNHYGAVTTTGRYVAGNFSKVILANFGPVEITKDIYSAGQTGQTILQMEAFVDMNVRQPGHLVRGNILFAAS